MDGLNWKKIGWSAIAAFYALILLVNGLSSVIKSQPSHAQTPVFPENSLETEGVRNRQFTGIQPLQRTGQFQLIYQPTSSAGILPASETLPLQFTTNSTDLLLQQTLQEARLFETLIDGLNNIGLGLPAALPVIIGDCQSVNAYYDPVTRSIRMCHEFIAGIAQDFDEEQNTSQEEAITDALYVSLFVFYHELGRALIDILEIPTTGKDEDAINELATILLLETANSETEKIILNSAIWLEMEPDLPGWNERNLNEERFKSLACLVYGSNPQQYQFLLEEAEISQETRDFCTREYTKKVANWNKLLLPHLARRNSLWDTQTSSPLSPIPNTSQERWLW
jgi:hypothetical protein